MRAVRWWSAVVMVAVVALGATTGAAVAAGIPVEPADVPVAAFPPAEQCGCHSALVQEWSESMHAQALTDPLYVTKVEEADKATGGKLGPFCKKCHGPAATMTGEIASGAELSPGTAQGVGCMFCHQVTGIAKGEPANTSQLVEPDGTRRAQLKDPAAPHPAAYSQFHEKAEFCGGCHNVNHPVNGMHLEATYTEWSESPWAEEGVVCQDCHMSAGAGTLGPSTGVAAAGGPQRDNIYHMSFVGAQVALGPSEAATAMLQSAAKVTLEAPEVLANGSSADAVVKIENVGAGHYLPTGLTEVRQMWLEVTAQDGDGEPIVVGKREFGTILEDDKGRSPVELWEATKIKSDDRIPPRGSVTETVTIEMPASIDARTVKASLLYKSAPDDFAQKAGVENPTTEMAVASAIVYSSEEAKAAASKPDPSGPSDTVMLIAGIAVVVLIASAVAFVVIRRRAE